MIKHIVMMKFLEKGTNGKSKEENLDLAKEIMDSLPNRIPSIKYWIAGININPAERAFDIVIDSEFETQEDLDSYIVHPAHKELIEFLNVCREKTHVVDFEM